MGAEQADPAAVRAEDKGDGDHDSGPAGDGEDSEEEDVIVIDRVNKKDGSSLEYFPEFFPDLVFEFGVGLDHGLELLDCAVELGVHDELDLFEGEVELGLDG